MSARASRSRCRCHHDADGGRPAAIREAFLVAYRERFGRALEELPVEALTWRLAAAAPGRDIDMRRQVVEGRVAQRGTRAPCSRAMAGRTARWSTATPSPRRVLRRPALVEERESTCVVPPGATVTVDAFRTSSSTFRPQEAPS